MPDTLSALKTPGVPSGAKPPNAVKFELRKIVKRKQKVQVGITIFHHVTHLFVSESSRTPKTLTQKKITISPTAHQIPHGHESTVVPCA